jgi:hypothetical protein
MKRTAALLAVTVAAAGLAAPSALAAPKKKPITKSYTPTTPMPDPTNYAQQGYSVCAQNVPESFHVEEFKVPANGSLHIELTDFTGDHDLLLMDGEGEELAYGGASDVTGSEIVDMRFKKAEKVQIVNCNWAGGPDAKVTYTFTYK